MTTMELISPLATAARSKFWEIKHVLKAQGHLFKRIRIMQRTVAASAMWCISMIPPDRGALGYCNTVQIQLIVWMMGISKGANEDWGSFPDESLESSESDVTQGWRRKMVDCLA